MKSKNLQGNKYTGKGIPHESAEQHVSGEAVYIDDMPEPNNLLHAYAGISTHSHAQIISIDLSEVKKSKGVKAVITIKDVPGKTDISPVFSGDMVLADKEVIFDGQPIFAVAATSLKEAIAASKKAKIKYKALPSILSIEEALEKKSFLAKPHKLSTGDHKKAIRIAKYNLKGSIHIGGQDHFYLEGQISIAVPLEDKGMLVYSSTQNPTEVQHIIADVLGYTMGDVTVETRRMGGGFGGKETQAAQFACIASILAHKTKMPVKMRIPRSEDMIMTGKRHSFLCQYEVGFNSAGKIEGINMSLATNAGCTLDLSTSILDRAMLHSDNTYYLPNALVTGYLCKTNTVSNTAFRGFGGPQGMLAIENVIEEIATFLDKDPLEIRRTNFYKKTNHNITHYHCKIEDNIINELVDELAEFSAYEKQKQEIIKFNQKNKFLKKGIALTPVKFGISFNVEFLNQAGALVHIYKDGSVHLNHGGTEMGQGLFTKVAQVVANEFDINVNYVKVSATRTDKVPNTSATAASVGTDLNGKAAQNAAKNIKDRLCKFFGKHFSVPSSDIIFKDNQIHIGKQKQITFKEGINLAFMNRISLSSSGFYQTPKIGHNKKTGKRRPFLYFAYGAATTEVVIDTLTGEYKVLKTDILHDVGNSINPAIDIGQIEGGFIQGLGWLTTEELMWDDKGKLLTKGPSTYKIPAISDTPINFRVKLFDQANKEDTIYHSKAVGEPPFMLAISVWAALRNAIANVATSGLTFNLNPPVTPERVLTELQKIKTYINKQKIKKSA